jgi:hypothetical protein
MAEFMGKDGFVWWQGVVEDRHDPLFLGRCRIRILGWHTEDKTDMPTESLPWAYPVQPITSAAQTGVGISPTGPVEGTWVVGFYRDGEQAQEPVFFGTLGGIPELPSVPNIGFNDPRGDTEEFHPFLAHKKDVQENPLDFKSELEKNIPYPPKRMTHFKPFTQPNHETSGPNDTSEENSKRFILRDGGGVVGPTDSSMYVEIEEYTTRSTYPREDHLNEPTTPRSAIGLSQNEFEYATGIVGQKQSNWGEMAGTGGISTASKQNKTTIVAGREQITSSSSFTWTSPAPQSLYGAKYPYNHVHQSESGHLIEVDDTPGFERLHRYHRTGTYEEIGALGQRIVNVVNENFHIGLNNDYTRIMGNKYESISGKLDIVSDRGYFHDATSGGINMKAGSFNLKLATGENISVTNEGMTLDAGKGTMTLKGHRIKNEFQDAAGTDKKRGGFTQEIGGLYSVETGSTALSSRGSTGITSGGALDFVVTGALHETIVNLSLPPASAARETLALLGDINFNSATGSVNLDCGRIPLAPGGTGLLSSLALTPSGISMSALVALTTFDLSASGIELKALGGLASVSISGTGIELSYGASSIKLGPAGITMEGVLINSKASGINTVEGSLVKLN